MSESDHASSRFRLGLETNMFLIGGTKDFVVVA